MNLLIFETFQMSEILYSKKIKSVERAKHQEEALDAVQNAICKALEAHESIKNANDMILQNIII
ncbi:hypothetical protein FMM75_19720 [Lachnospiraceae bacterium MD335]|nr:hypothetical protein [Lachnospiraceae bacterium MD335]